MSVKASMFNRCVEDEAGDLILYNSMEGTGSIRVAGQEKKEKLTGWLNRREPMEEEDDPDFQALVRGGYLIPAERDEKALRELRHMERIMDPALHLVVHTTGRCNFRCQYCALDFQPKPMPREIQDRLIRFVRRRISQHSRVTISWFGGEPLLEMEVIEHISREVMEICRRAHKPYIGAITSNGYLLTPENIETLLRCRVMYYTITVDGLKDTHDRQRFLANGKPTFDRVVGNLRYIRDHVPNPMLSVIIRTNVTREILDRIEEYYRFYDGEFGGDSRFSLFVRPASDWGGDRVKEMSDSLLRLEEMGEVYRRLSRIPGRILFRGNFGDLDPGGATCSAAFKNKYTVGTAGQLFKCDSSESPHVIGRLLPDGNAEIDEGQEALWVTGYRLNPSSCDECSFSGPCLMTTCPKPSADSGHHNCGHVYEPSSLLLLAAATLHPDQL